MSRNSSKKKKSTSKYRNFKISPLIPVIAIIEVIVLVVISTYAWFIVSQEKNAYTGIIAVDADSGLDIDFKDATYKDKINLWDYVPDDFEFSPVTSLDGRNVFVPTSGTFGNDETNNIKFRDATINDINTKFLDVDFMLTNTTSQDVNVYLNNNSHFRVYDNAQQTSGEEQKNSRALRLAFYTNDAKHGNVSSSILENTKSEDAILDNLEDRVTVYFEKPDAWTSCNAHIWTGNNVSYVSWPGSAMTHVAGKVYSYTFSNKNATYTKVVFNNGSTGYGNQTNDLNIVDGNIYKISAGTNTSGDPYNTKTVYFVKPSDWSGVRAHAFKASGQSTSFTNYPGDECYYCGADVYSYTFPTTYDGNNMGGIVFNNLGNQNQKTNDLEAVDGRLYYFANGGAAGSCSDTTYSTKTVYFNNSENWVKPYAKVKAPSGHEVRVPMTNLSGGIYYATFPSVYTQVGFEDRNGYNNNTTAVTTNYKYTQYTSSSAIVPDGQIYRASGWTSSGYTMTEFSYTGYVGTSAENTYAVISPGVSAGFQRSYTPVVGATTTTGVPTQVVPAFACSLDNYIKGSQNPMFTIPAGGMLDLSMVVWLEGTDKDCTGTTYAGKNIDLYLEYSTNIAGQEQAVDQVTNYTYRFYDKTREVWTSDRLTNDAGVSVAPVIQLYDNTDKRGYLMHAASTSNIGGVRKVDVWECSAPSTLYTSDHDLYFRRVDPYNEDEIWNYWHPVSPKSGSNETALSGSVVSFTAFADGAPASAAESGIEGNDAPLTAATSASTPARSCGGVWGNVSTKLFTMVDGTDGSGGYWFTNNNAVMTMYYTYSYGGGKTQTIEYKASGPYYGQLYYVVIPTDTSKISSIKFRRFYNFNKDYAMNIYHRNSSMSYDSSNVITPTGTFNDFGYFRKDGNSIEGWYGNGINYINISYKDEGNNKDMFAGARYTVEVFHGGSGSKTIRLYTPNGKFSLNNFNGYLVVFPGVYNDYQLRHVSATNWTDIYDYGDEYSITNYRNAVITHWQGGSHNVGGTYNNNQGTYGWPAIPSNWYPD